MSSPIVKLEKVSKIYRQGRIDVPALRSVDLEIMPAEFSVLAGPSGSGKTTLLNVVGALQRPTSGRVMISGRELGGMKGRELATLRLEHLGFVFQAYNLIPVLSARENAEYVLLLQGVGAAERRRRVDEVLAAVGLTGLEERRPAELSGGQQQRVAVARAIAATPDLVLADEPTANLDSRAALDLIDLMGRLNQERKVTFLISSHDARVIERARRVIMLEDGRVTSDTQGEPHAA
ncbi:MAG TPA: ABC transporter ATP-binding protein [Polyangiaceae bacterium]|jgi:putative ABC transport system ATP-binding protein|nr:ABC transporter ATP-binding protein [Polyangiaceae bacterium]